MITTITATTEGTAQVLYNGQGITTYLVTNTSATDKLHLQIDGLHPAERYTTLSPGVSMLFRLGFGALSRVVAWSSGGTVTVDHGEVANM